MITVALKRRAEELAEARVSFVTATVVRVQHPASVEPGAVALVHSDGTIEGFVGGVCAEQSVRLYSLTAIERGEPLLLRILPDGPGEPEAPQVARAQEVLSEDGAVTVQNPCLSGGALEIFLEPSLPAPRMIVAGDTPIADALRRLAPEVGLQIASERPGGGELAVVVATHGRDELGLLQAALRAGVRYVGLVASQKRGTAVIKMLRDEGLADDVLERIDTPAGLELGARTAPEIALSILAQIVAVRRSEPAGSTASADLQLAAPTAVDPICGMTVMIDSDTTSIQVDGNTLYFCGEGCKRSFEQQNAA